MIRFLGYHTIHGFFLTVLIFLACSAKADDPNKIHRMLGTEGTPEYLPFNINRMFGYYWQEGYQEYMNTYYNHYTDHGLEYPKGTARAISSADLYWAGKFYDGHQPALRVGVDGRPGSILGIRTGQLEDPSSASVRIYRIRRDLSKADLKEDASETYQKPLANITNADAARLKADYLKDYREWPWQKGAPFDDSGYLGPDGVTIVGRNNGVLDWGEDVNRNGILDPGEDVNGNGKLDGETPGIAGADQVLWTVFNDLYSYRVSGVEVQMTVWGYNRPDALGNVIFKRFRMIYKGLATTTPDARIDSLYVMQEVDAYLGFSGFSGADEYVGCDTLLSTGFVYNAGPDRNYTLFGIAPPSIGYDFMEGPLVPGVAGQDRNHNGIDDAQDYGMSGFRRVGPGFINLPLTAFVYADYYPPRRMSRYYLPYPYGTDGVTAWWQMARGLPPQPVGPPDPDGLHNPVTGRPSPLWSSGDPVRGQGWMDDGYPILSGQRQMVCSSGPFSLAVGDSQEFVIAVVGGLGNNNLASVNVMKYYDKMAQLAFDNSFNTPQPPPSPSLRITSLDGSLVLDWEWDSAAVAATENTVQPGNYRFEGYNVYQMPGGSASLDQGRVIARCDLVDGIRTISQEVFDQQSGEVLVQPVEFGTDNGIHRSVLVTRDSIMRRPLVNGQTYYYAVTAYSYTPDPSNPVHTVESAPAIVSAIPESPNPGTHYVYGIGDTVHVTSVVGSNDAIILPVIYNPAVQTGATYHLQFDTSSTGTLFWNLKNAGTGRIIYSNISDIGSGTPYRVAEDGFDLYVSAPPIGLKDVIDSAGNNVYGPESSNPSYAVFSVFRLRNLLDGNPRNETDYEIRFDGHGSYAVEVHILFGQTLITKVPFSVWNVGRQPGDTPVQVIGAFKDSNNTPGRWNITRSGTVYNGTLYKVFEPIFISSIPYPTSNDSANVYAVRTPVFISAQSREDVNSAVFGVLIADKDSDSLPPPIGTRIRFTKWHRIQAGDVKAITPAKPTVGDVSLARAEVSRITVFPNPIYGNSTTPTGVTRKSVTFSHLPDKANIRIFNLAGVFVRLIVKDDPPNSSQFATWDLQNQSGLPVASGLYLAHIEMPDLGMSKVLKIIVIQETEYRRTY